MNNERRKAGLKAKIKAAATAVFLRKGYSETKIIDIANEANISPSTIYLYFDGKKQLFNALNIPEVARMRPEFDRRREDITRVALALFGERGFEDTTMDDIARKVGFSKAALYQYCSSKEDLFFQVLQLYTHAIPPDDVVEGANCADWKKAVHNVAESYMAISRDPDRAAFLGSVIRDSHKFPEFGAVYYEKSFCTARRNFSEFVSRLQREGIVRADLDVDVAVTAFFGSLTSYTIFYDTIRGIPKDVDEDKFIDTIADMFIRGVEAQPEEKKE